MPPDASADTRLEELESRLAWQEDALEQLNTVISRQWDIIDRLQRRAEALEDRLGVLEAEKGGAPVAAPPHY